MKMYNAQGEVVFDFASISNLPSYARKNGDMVAGDVWELEKNEVIKNNRFVFTGIIGAFNTLRIGRKGNYFVAVDSTNVVLYSGTTQKATYPHGLTIQNNIQVLIETSDTDYKANVTVISNGVAFEQKNVDWGCAGVVYAESVGSTLTDCVYSWTSDDFDAPIYAFGDSYFTINDEARWTHYLLKNGYGNNVLLNGIAGQYSSDAVKSFRNVMSHGQPKYVLWCLGMNNSDTDTVISTEWKNATVEVIDTCRQRGIELILATIPNVPTYAINNFKNQYVYDSGLRYIDFAKAVNAEGTDRAWFEGMLENDTNGVHPSVSGAKVLYMQALADFPELMG